MQKAKAQRTTPTNSRAPERESKSNHLTTYKESRQPKTINIETTHNRIYRHIKKEQKKNKKYKEKIERSIKNYKNLGDKTINLNNKSRHINTNC